MQRPAVPRRALPFGYPWREVSQDTTESITRLLGAWRGGEQGALEELVDLLYPDLHRLARGLFLQERVGHTLQPTALVHEVYLRLFGAQEIDWRDRAHFLAICARIMRRILVDHARRRGFSKRGGGAVTLSIDHLPELPQAREPDLIDLDQALSDLAGLDREQSQVVELRFFGGLTQKEISSVLGLSTATVDRRWRLARAWLFLQLDPESATPS